MAGRRRRRRHTEPQVGRSDKIRSLIHKLDEFCTRMGGTPNVRISDISEIFECMLPENERVWVSLDEKNLEFGTLHGERLVLDLTDLPETINISAHLDYSLPMRERIPSSFEDIIGGATYRRGRISGHIAATGARKLTVHILKDFRTMSVEIDVP